MLSTSVVLTHVPLDFRHDFRVREHHAVVATSRAVVALGQEFPQEHPPVILLGIAAVSYLATHGVNSALPTRAAKENDEQSSSTWSSTWWVLVAEANVFLTRHHLQKVQRAIQDKDPPNRGAKLSSNRNISRHQSIGGVPRPLDGVAKCSAWWLVSRAPRPARSSSPTCV